MKKIIYMAAVLMMSALTACNNELADEYKHPATMTEFAQSYKVFVGETEVQDVVPAGASIIFTGSVDSKYGPVYVYLSYAVCTPERQEQLGLGKYVFDNPSIAWQNYWAYTATWSIPNDDDGTMQIIPAPAENEHFSITMPGQPAGSVVAMSLVVKTPYLVSLGATTVYVVADDNGDDNGGEEGEPEEVQE